MKQKTGDSKLATGNGRLGAGNSRSGIALIITLTIMALLLILAMAFMTNMRSERQVSFNYRRQVEAKQAALAGLNTAIAKMSRFYTDAEAANGSVATMAGRFYYTNGNDKVNVPIPGASARTAYHTNNTLMFSWIKGAGVFTASSTNWADKINLNGGNYKWPLDAAQSGIYLPIANPSVHPKRAGTAGTSWGPDKVGIYAGYMRTQTTRNPKYAFWIDDESSKINISNAYTRDLNGAGFNNMTNFASIGAAAIPGLLYAKILPSDGSKTSPKHVSSVDLKMLDTGVVTGNPALAYNPEGPNWTYSDTLSSIEAARHTGTWQPFQTPDEVLSLNNKLTMNDYQAVKSCLTAWSVENEDPAQLFKYTSAKPLGRTNVSDAFMTTMAMTNFCENLVSIYQLGASPSAAKFFGATLPLNPNSPCFSNKYSDISQPFINGGVSQIVANIASYLTDPTRTDIGQTDQGVRPYGSCPPHYDPTPTSVPVGACGLWKAAYMNEIALAFAWYPVDKDIVDPKKDATRWQLYASVCVELINPYEIPMPRSNVSYQEQYRIYFDKPFGVSATTTKPVVPAQANPTPPTTMLQPGTIDYNIANNSYTLLTKQTNLTYSWAVTGPSIPTNAPPTVTAINITFPLQIRQMMENTTNPSLSPPKDRLSIIDWYSSQTQKKVPGGFGGTITINNPALSTLTFAGVNMPPPSSDDAFWSKPTARVSIAKNDPRVHAWYDAKDKVTLAAQNHSSVLKFTGGDSESGTVAANRSNFVIAERGMNSIGELGFIHTGRPWRSLSLQYYGAQTDETDAMGSGPKAFPDWAILDIFSVNSPPIYGRVNINNGGWHLGNSAWGPYQGAYPNCPTFEEPALYPRHPNLLATWNYGLASFLTAANYQWSYVSLRTSAYSYYPYHHVAYPTYDSTSVPLAAALSVIPDYRFRNKLANYIYYQYHPLNSTRNTFAPLGDPADTTFLPNRDIWNPYYTVGQICEVPYMNYRFDGSGTQAASTDADKEDTVRRIINVLTTRGDVFTVHAIGSADSGEARLTAVVERIRNPSAPQIIDRNQFRIRQMRWLSE